MAEEEQEEEVAEQYWEKYKKETVFALLSPFLVSLTAGDLDSRTFCYCIAQESGPPFSQTLSAQLQNSAGLRTRQRPEEAVADKRTGGYVRTKLVTYDNVVEDIALENEDVLCILCTR